MLTNGAQELATYITDAETLKGLMPVLANMAKQGGVNSEQGMMSYATMLGKVMGGDMGGMSKRGYIFTDAEKQAFKLMTEEQKLAFITKTVNESIGQQAGMLNALNTQSVQTLSIQMDNVRKSLGGALKPFMDFFNLVTMKWKLAFYEDILKGLQFIQKHINGVVIALYALGVAIVALGVYFAILKREAIASAISSAIAWAVANAPLLATIATILLIITAIGVLLAYSEKTFPAIGGIIGGVAGIAKEVGAQIKYYFGMAIEGVVNGFLRFKQTLINVFVTVFDTLLSGVEKVAKAMDKIFDTSLADKISGFRSQLQAMAGEAKEFKLGWSDDRQGFANAWKNGQEAGSQFGSELSDKLQGGIDKMTSGLKKAVGDGLSEQGDQFKYASDGSLLVSDTSSVDIAQDYKDLLSAKATERFFLKQSNIKPEINIEMNGTNVTAEDVRDKVASYISSITNTITEGLYGNGVE